MKMARAWKLAVKHAVAGTTKKNKVSLGRQRRIKRLSLGRQENLSLGRQQMTRRIVDRIDVDNEMNKKKTKTSSMNKPQQHEKGICRWGDIDKRRTSIGLTS